MQENHTNTESPQIPLGFNTHLRGIAAPVHHCHVMIITTKLGGHSDVRNIVKSCLSLVSEQRQR